MHSPDSEGFSSTPEGHYQKAYEVGRPELGEPLTDKELIVRLGDAESTLVLAHTRLAELEGENEGLSREIERLKNDLRKAKMAHAFEQLRRYVATEQTELERAKSEKLAQARDYAIRERDEARREADQDSLTGLLNSNAYKKVEHEEQDPNKPFQIMYIDVNALKAINDRFDGMGHQIGDEVLAGLGAIIMRTIIEANPPLGAEPSAGYRAKAFRVGGDEFKLWVDKDDTRAEQIKENILARFDELLNNDSENLGKPPAEAFAEKGFTSGLAIGYGATSTEAEARMHKVKEGFYDETRQIRRQ